MIFVLHHLCIYSGGDLTHRVLLELANSDEYTTMMQHATSNREATSVVNIKHTSAVINTMHTTKSTDEKIMTNVTMATSYSRATAARKSMIHQVFLI